MGLKISIPLRCIAITVSRKTSKKCRCWITFHSCASHGEIIKLKKVNSAALFMDKYKGILKLLMVNYTLVLPETIWKTLTCQELNEFFVSLVKEINALWDGVYLKSTCAMYTALPRCAQLLVFVVMFWRQGNFVVLKAATLTVDAQNVSSCFLEM